VRSRIWLLFLSLGCSTTASTLPPADTSVADGADATADARDAKDASSADRGCDRGCFWDCLPALYRCREGGIVYYAYGGAPPGCCHFGDPWPYPGPACTSGVAGTCPSGTCATPPEQIDVDAADPEAWRAWCVPVDAGGEGD